MNPSYPRSRPDQLVAFPAEQLSFIDHWYPSFRTREERYEASFRKLLFFLFREGPWRTWRKYRARKRKEALGRKPVCMIVRDKESGRYYGGLQHRFDQEVYYFFPGASWETEPSREDLTPIQKLDPFLGYLPEGWEGSEGPAQAFQPIRFEKEQASPKGAMDLYAVGCGSYMLSEVLPLYEKRTPLKAAIDVDRSVLDLPELQKAELRSNDLSTALEMDKEPERPKLAYIASYHSWHSAQAIDFLEGTKDGRVIIEKPPCITEEDLRSLWQVFDPKRTFIAFHRRYAPMFRWVREWIHEVDEAVMAGFWIHEAPIGPDHWYFAPNQGTRIAGNLCHWIDLALFWMRSDPTRVTVSADEDQNPDASFYTLHFADGSMVNFIPTDLGDPSYGVREWACIQGKEQEIHLQDALRCSRWLRGKWKGYRRIKRDKGHQRMNRDYLERILRGDPAPYPAEDLLRVTRIQNAFIELIAEGGGTKALDLSEPAEKNDLSAHA